MVHFVILTLIITYFSKASSIKISVERGHDYDRVIWDGDCSKINAIHVAFENEKICECKKLINVNGIKSELFGAIYPDKDGFLKCSYNYRETGANKFLNYPFHSPINTVSDALFGKVLQLSGNRYHRYWEYKLNTNISIKEFRLYTFNIKKPFINIKNTMFQWRNYTSGTRRRYYLKMINRITRHFRGELIQIHFDRTELEINETTSYGFAVVKFVGDTSYDLKIPALQEATLQESNEECKYEIAAFVLVGITGLLVIIIIALVLKTRPRPEMKLNGKKAVAGTVEKKDGHGRKKDRHDRKIAENNHLSFQDYRNLDQVEMNSYKTLKLGAAANGNAHSDNVKKVDHVYDTYGPGNGTQNMESNVHVVGNEYYNDCY